MPVEIEAKMKVDDLASTRARLQEGGATLLGDFTETNVFFDTEDRSLLAADQGLRLRVSAHAQSNSAIITMTFKGPRQHGQLKSREEIETTIGDFAQSADLLEHLGYTRILSFEKRRQSWTLAKCKIELDELPFLGSFVEIEGPTDDAILTVRQQLHLADRPLVKASYIAMLMTHLQENANPNREVRFPR